MDDYDIYYNNSNINKSDGVILYVKNIWPHNSVVKDINNLKILSTKIRTNEEVIVKISAVYKCHAYSNTAFVDSIKNCLCKNHNKKTCDSG